MKKIHIFAPQNHSTRSICDVGKMASHSFVTRHCEAVQRHDHSSIEYIYAADGTKLRIIHRPAGSTALTDSIDYVGNLILKNGQPSMYLFDGGYATFNSNGAVNGWHYYIQDYMGNNRMVVNKNGTVEQVTHYYPYGGVIGDISTNENVQNYKFEGKELDRTFGLDNYDIHARQYFAMAPMWDKIDPLAEDSPQFSPYSYCMGDPVNLGDFNGMIPDSLEAALLSQDAYNPNFGEGPGKWSCISRSLGGSFKWAIYTKGEGDEQEYVLAFAGSDDFYDYLIDIYQGNGNIKGEASEYAQIEYGKAIKLAAAFVSFINEKEGTIVGHSLGASLGSLAAMASNTQAVVFNPAAIYDNTISTFGIDTSGHEKMIATYVVRGELITYINGFTDNSKTYGTIKPIEPKSGLSIGDRHRISNIINTFNRNGHKL